MKKRLFHSLYSRLLSMFLAILLVVMLVMAFFSYSTIRQNAINTKMGELMAQAKEIAYLASQVSLTYTSSILAPANKYLSRKIQTVYDEFNAYILVVDRNGRVADNMYTARSDNQAFAESLDTATITETLKSVLQGNEVQTQSTTASGTVFTLAVPWMQDDVVLGAVFIHTPAQVIEAEYRPVIWQLVSGFAIATALAAFASFVLARRLTQPLRSVAQAAHEMELGNFAARAQSSGTQEMADLSAAFNAMAEKLAITEQSRRDFVANVSHELRSPVTSIGGYVGGMLDGTIPPQQQHHYLEIVKDETDRLTKLISDLLHLSRMERENVQLNKTVFDINELLRRSLIRRMTDIDKRGLEIKVDFENEKCLVFADADRIEQVVINILDNALKFVPDHGLLALSTKEYGRQITVMLANNGPAVAKEDQPHLFERFYTANKAHTSGSGTGLGLSICQRILELHRQSIRYVDIENGAAFAFTLEKADKKEILFAAEAGKALTDGELKEHQKENIIDHE